MNPIKLAFPMTLLFVYSCSNADNNIIKPNSKMGRAAACAPNKNKIALSLAEAPTYQGNIKAIIDSKCLGCHKQDQTPPYLDTYEGLKASETAPQQGKIKSSASLESTVKPMPKPPKAKLAATDIQLFKSWVAAGFPLATPQGTSTPTASTTASSTASSTTTPKVVYSGEIEQLLKSNCTACHGPGMTSPDLSSYNAAKDAASGALDAMKDGSMPTSGKLPQPTIDKFKKWIDDGLEMKLTDSSADADCGN